MLRHIVSMHVIPRSFPEFFFFCQSGDVNDPHDNGGSNSIVGNVSVTPVLKLCFLEKEI